MTSLLGRYENGEFGTGRDSAALGLVHFTGAYLTKYGGVNDEAMAGHALYGHGLEPYAAHVVRNSEWIEAAERANSVHPDLKPGWSDRYKLSGMDLDRLALDVNPVAAQQSFPP